MRELLNHLLWLPLGWLLLNGWMYLQQPAMVFIPFDRPQQTPADWGLDYEEIWLLTADGVKLHGWYLPVPGARQVVLFLHGNAGNISHRRESLEIFHRLGLNVLIFDYRGYGNSEGRPSERGLYRDADAAWRWLVESRGFVGSEIVLFGRSLGGVVAAQLASRVRPRKLIVESAFSSARDVARELFPLLSRLVLLRFEFDATSWIAQVRCPVLVIHSTEDEIIPFTLGEKLYQAANPPKRLLRLHGGHNDGFLLSQPAYQQVLGGFIRAM